MIRTPISPDFVRGAAELETTERGLRPHRLPSWVRDQFPDPQLLLVESQPSGIRLAFATAARTIELTTHPTRIGYRGVERPRGHVDLIVDGQLAASDAMREGDLIEMDLASGKSRHVPGGSHTSTFSGLDAGDKLVELWLPHNESVELVAIRTDASVRAVSDPARLWVHHGSSISHGSNASTPSRTWPAIAARRGHVALQNLGFGGSALVDPFVARVIRDAPADLISVKLGINVVNVDSMRLRAFVPAVHGFLDAIRDGHPETPLVLISPIFCGIHEDTPGPGAIDPASLATDQVRFIATGRPEDAQLGRLTLRVIRDALASLAERRADDPNLHYLDGTQLYGAADAIEMPLPDALHPDTATHHMIGERFAEYAFSDAGPFGTP